MDKCKFSIGGCCAFGNLSNICIGGKDDKHNCPLWQIVDNLAGIRSCKQI